MNILFVVFTLVVTINAIRVPTVWPNENIHSKHLKPIIHGSYHRKTVHDRQDLRVYPHNTVIRKKHHHVHNRPLKLSKLPPRLPHHYSKSKKFHKKHKPRQSMWTPIAPYSISTTLGYMTPKPNITFDLKQYPKTHYTPASSEYVTSRTSPLYKNYRDDRTYEQEETNDEKIIEPLPDVERPSIKESDHEHPADIPATPVYPGEGEWAKPGRKHRPFVTKQKYSRLPEESEEKPDGHEIFENAEKLFDEKAAKFDNTRKNKYPESQDEEDQNGHLQKDEESSEEEGGFVPTTLYAQVRRSENEKHLPSDAEDSENGRLKEVIKDSKILTVYTEEGYEDSAYDHTGHEKEAEDSQGYKEYNKKEEKDKKPKKGSLENHRLTSDDQDEDGTSKIYKTVENPKVPKRKKYKPKNKNIYNKLIKTESTKTMKLKEEPNGTQMEITGEIKTMTNPNNDTTENVVQILPKVIKFSNPDTLTTEIVDSPAPQEQVSLPETPIVSSSEKVRRKRYTNDFPKFDVKTDFIDGIIKNDIPNLNQQAEIEKYPYYNSRHINQNSPLKYSENLNNIPVKTEGRMAFYEQANQVQCPEVDEDIETIPKRIQEVEKSVNSGEKLENGEEAGKSPRLGKLGQRIDCFKRKYFGENPLDSPFFSEQEVEPVPPLFKVLQERSAGFQAHHTRTREPLDRNIKKKYHSKFRNVKAKEEQSFDTEKNNPANSVQQFDSDEKLNDVRYHDQVVTSKQNNLRQSINNAQFTPQVEIINVDTFKSIDHVTTESPTLSLITTPNYSVHITPQHIYDQIKLLEFLPSQPIQTIVSTTEENPRKGKVVEDDTEATSLELRANPRYQNFVPRRPPRMKKKRPQFDVDSFIKDPSRRVTIIPNSYNNENDAIYNEQTPLDQMNVFADVLNNIKNGSNDPLRLEASNYNKPNLVDNYQKPVIRMRVPPKRIHMKIPDSVKYSNERQPYYQTTTAMPTTMRTTTKKSRRGSVRFAITTEKETSYDDYSETDDEPVYGKKKISVKTSTSAFPEEEDIEEDEDSEASGTHTTETIQKPPAKKTVEIIGLVPPSKYHYRTIYQPVEEFVAEPIVSESEIVNNYHVLGMKPPSTKQKVYDYSEFQRLLSGKKANNHKYRNISHRRGKRSPQRKSYFEVVRGQSSNDEETAAKDEDDDYVPHRPKNWHWDEKLKKIVYDKPEENEQSDVKDDEEEIVEIEVEESTPRNIQQTTTRRSFTTTTPPNGPSYVDFVQILRSKEGYVSIPDPTTTKEDMKIETTTPSTTTIRTEPTKPPEFLSFVSKLRQSDSYKMIEEKNKTKTATTTTELPEEEEDEEIDDTETALSNVQNAPGRGAVEIGQNFKIFDVNEFMPKVKHFSPRTEIDYSKYKTIQRARPKTTTEANEEEENVRFGKPHTPLIIEESDEPTPEASTEGKLEIFELSRPTTQSSTTTSSTTVKIQRTRGRRPTTTHRTVASSVSNVREDAASVAAVPANKPKRFYPRRRQPHIRQRTTTLKTKLNNEDDVEPEETKRVIIRRHNTGVRSPKIISLEEIIKMDQPKEAEQQLSTHSSDTKNSKKSGEVTVDDILKNINRLKEISVEEAVPDYSLDIKSDVNDEENAEGKDEYFDDETTKIALDNNGTTNRKLVISKDKQQGIHYTSVR